MLKNEEIEWLKRTFQPSMETVKKLPSPKSVPNFFFAELKKSEEERHLCVAIDGRWFKIATLNLIEEV